MKSIKNWLEVKYNHMTCMRRKFGFRCVDRECLGKKPH